MKAVHKLDLGTGTVNDLAELLNLSPRRVQQLVDQGVLQRESRGTYALLPNMRSYLRSLQQLAHGTGEAGDDLTTERARLAKEQADRIAMQNAQARGELLPTTALEEAQARASARAMSILDGIPVSLRRRVSGISRDVVQVVEAEIRLACEAIARVQLVDLDLDDDDEDAEE